MPRVNKAKKKTTPSKKEALKKKDTKLVRTAKAVSVSELKLLKIFLIRNDVNSILRMFLLANQN